jgi:DNA polymerase-1
MAWLGVTGAPFDVGAWADVTQAAQEEAAGIKAELDSLLGPAERVNWDSPVQIKNLLSKRGYAVESTREEVLKELADVGEPLARLLLRYRGATKRVGTYGTDWLRHVHPVTGRVYGGYWQIGTVTGRMSCDGPNLQNIPRDPTYRSKFKPEPGRVLIKTDLSQIELRYIAQMSREPVLVTAFLRGDDLYAITALMLDCERQTGKAIDLGLSFGMGVDRLRDKILADTGRDVPRETVAAWHAQYYAQRPVLRQWQQKLGHALSTESRTLTGRRRLTVTGYSERINSPVQGSACDGLKVALALLWETRHQCPDAAPVLCVHDELVIEGDAATAERTRAWVEDCLMRGARAVLGDGPGAVPVTVESVICQDWSGTPVETTLINCSES